MDLQTPTEGGINQSELYAKIPACSGGSRPENEGRMGRGGGCGWFCFRVFWRLGRAVLGFCPKVRSGEGAAGSPDPFLNPPRRVNENKPEMLGSSSMIVLGAKRMKKNRP